MGRGSGHELAQESAPSGRRRPRTFALEHGNIVVAQSQAEIDQTLERWRAQGPQLLALDLECAASATVPNGSGLHPHLGTIRLMQLAVADGGQGPEALVIDCWRHRADDALALIGDSDWPTLVHYAPMEARWLAYAHGQEIGGLIDTREASALASPESAKSHSLAAASKRFLGIDLDKEQQNSYWDAARLSSEQLVYAGKDVLALLDLWAAMERKIEPEQLETIRERSARSQERASTQTTPRNCESDRAKRMIKACRSLTELERVEESLSHLRLHHSNQEKVARALRRTRRKLERGEAPPRPVKVEVSGWRQPF